MAARMERIFARYACGMYVLTEEEFDAVYRALELANSGYEDSQLEELISLEWKAWVLLQDVRGRAAPPA